MNSSAAPAVGRCRLPFTASQWQELEQQAFVFKYLAAGVPVPPELLLPIRRSLQSMAARFYHPSMGYCCPFNGKMIDPEPGRCRRTDGKKWRCSKDAHPDSKYCERHMHRSRNRSRKPVELQNLSQLQSSSSSFSPALTATSLAPSANGLSAGSGASGGGRFPSGIPLHSPGDAGSTSSATQVAFTGSSFNQLQMDPGYCGMGSRDCRYLREAKNEGDGNSFFSMTSASARGLEFKSSLDSSSRPMRPPVPSYSLSKSRHDSLLLESNARLQSMQGFGRVDLSSLPKQQQQQRFFDSHFNSLEPAKNPRQPFFDEWPKARGSWPDLEDERSKITLFSTTHLSISLPMSSDFSSSSRSASGVP